MTTRFGFLALVLLCAAGSAFAQGGCVNSPECPTAVLALAGAAAVGVVRRFKR